MRKKILSFLFVVMLAASALNIKMAVSAAEGDVSINATNFPDDIFRAYVSEEFDSNGDGVLSAAEIAAVKEIDVDRKGISSLKGVEFFTALEQLISSFNNLGSLDVSKNTALKHLQCDGNNLTSLDVSKNTELEHLWCCEAHSWENWEEVIYNNLTSLDLSNNIKLTELFCSSNKISNLDVSNNLALRTLECGGNNFSNLDVSKNISLGYLDCTGSNISNLDVSNNLNLTVLYCRSNKLNNLDLSNNSELTELSCSSNQLTNLDLSNNPKLLILSCGNNNLSSLDLSNNPQVYLLSSSNNNMTIEFVKNGFSIPGLDVSRMSDIVGATIVNGKIVPNAGATEITYTYAVNSNWTATFKLVDAGHTFGTDWKTDATSHWHECDCGEKGDVAAHTPSSGSLCTADRVCTVCGRVLKVATGHTFGTNWKSDATSHWHECACGEKSNVAAHTPGAAATATTDQICTVCGKVLVKAGSNNDKTTEESTEGTTTGTTENTTENTTEKTTDNTTESTTEENTEESTEETDVSDTTDKIIEVLGDADKAEIEAAIESGKEVNIYVDVKDATETVPAEDKEKVESAIADNKYEIGIYFDITLLSKIGDNEPKKITELLDSISVTITIPDNLINTDKTVAREYHVVRVHDGKADVLEGRFDAESRTFTFKTDRFSTYALVYNDTTITDSPTESNGENNSDETAGSDVETEPADNDGNSSGKGTGGSKKLVIVIVVATVVLAGGAAVAVVLVKRKKKTTRQQ